MAEMKSLTLNDVKYDSFVDPVARALAEASAVIKSVCGESISVTDASEGKPHGFSLYGKTTQSGIPTPDYPVELVSAGNSGSITVTVTGKNESKRTAVSTPNGLPGIPVTSGGNYIDSNGQQWICDEIDFQRGVYVQRIYTQTILANSITLVDNTYLEFGSYCSVTTEKPILMDSSIASIKSDFAIGITSDTRTNTQYVENYRIYTTAVRGFSIRYPASAGAKTIEKAKNDFAGRAVSYALESPVETPLPSEPQTAYDSMLLYRDQTAISNDANAGMSLDYVIDIRKYIDNQISGAILAATVE